MIKFYTSHFQKFFENTFIVFFLLVLTSLSAYSQTGVLDVTFGNKGKVISKPDDINHQLYSVAIQPDGKIVVIGSNFVIDEYLQTVETVLMRYNSDGSLDSTFGENGGVSSDLLPQLHELSSLVLQKDGKIVFGANIPEQDPEDSRFAVIRYNNDGTKDASFGGNGMITTNFSASGNFANNIKISDDGKIVVAGTIVTENQGSPVHSVGFARFEANGTPDNTFGINGYSNIGFDINGAGAVTSLVLQDDNKIISGGYDTTQFFVTRVNSTGSIDATFGNDGITRSNFSNGANAFALILQPDSKILIGGQIFDYPTTLPQYQNTNQTSLALLRLNKDGTYDTTFGFKGHVTTPINGGFSGENAISSLLLAPDGKVSGTGIIHFYDTAQSADLLLVRYNSNGTLDTTFGKKGLVTTDLTGVDDKSYSSALQKDGKIVSVGSSETPNSSFRDNFTIVRYDVNALLYYNTLKGYIYIDENKNNIKDANEVFVNNARLITTKAGIDTILINSSNGKFSLDIDTGSYVTAVKPYLPYYTPVPATFTTSHTNYFNVDNVIYALQPIEQPQSDLTVYLSPITHTRPGFATTYVLFYQNQGTDIIDNATIELIKSDKLTFITAEPAASTVKGDTLRWKITNLRSLGFGSISINFKPQAPPVVNTGDTLSSVATIFTSKPDLTPLDNTASLADRVVGAYDPNDKVENHSGSIRLSEIKNGENLQYTIRFQNTGTDTAFNVYIKDTLSDNVDWSTLKMISSSHNFQLNVNDGRYCSWELKNINLVDSNTNEALSHGYIVYSVKAKRILSAGDVINNTAHIYFDYNLPVQTNIEKTTVEYRVLPLKLITFTVKSAGKSNIAEWLTDKEINLDRFEIEKGANSTNLTTVGIVKAGRSNKYAFTDSFPGKAINYYRLKMVDKDGQFEYSPVRSVVGSDGFYVSIYPNPARQRITVQMNGLERANRQLSINSTDGKIVFQKKLPVQTGQLIQLLDISMLQTGSYFLTVFANGHVQSVIKFQKM